MWGMRGRFRGAVASGRVFAALLALVLLSRLLIPSGYMIGPTDGGGPGLVLCGQAAAAMAAEDSHEGHGMGHEAPSKPVEPPCPYAALAAPVLPPSPPVAPPPEILNPAREPKPNATAVRPAPAAPPPPATGPPLSA